MPNYYDIDEILMEDSLLPCTSKITCKNLGFLAPDSISDPTPNPQNQLEGGEGGNPWVGQETSLAIVVSGCVPTFSQQ